MAGADGVIRGPAGQGRVAAVSQDDIADAAVAVLRRPGDHERQTYDLTGPVAVTLDEVAATLAAVTGREITYVDETLEEARASRAAYGAPDWEVDAWISSYTAIAAGELERISPDVVRLAGQEPMTLEELLAAHPGSLRHLGG